MSQVIKAMCRVGERGQITSRGSGRADLEEGGQKYYAIMSVLFVFYRKNACKACITNQRVNVGIEENSLVTGRQAISWLDRVL